LISPRALFLSHKKKFEHFLFKTFLEFLLWLAHKMIDFFFLLNTFKFNCPLIIWGGRIVYPPRKYDISGMMIMNYFTKYAAFLA
jgi:hypothetical protein